MNDNQTAIDLMTAALQRAASAAGSRISKTVSVVDVESFDYSGALLKFDLSFGNNGHLIWYITNDDATGFADMLIGGSGSRDVALTEVHLDALTSAIGDMFEQYVAGISAGLKNPLSQGDIDLGMADAMPLQDESSIRVIKSLNIDGFGGITIVQDIDYSLASFISYNALDIVETESENSGIVQEDASALNSSKDEITDEVSNNVVSLPSHSDAEVSAGSSRNPADLEMLMNVPLPLTVELGNTQKTIKQLIEFNVGSIIELSKLAGDPLDIKVNDRVIARGEVVVIDEEFGIRITEIASPEARLRGIG